MKSILGKVRPIKSFKNWRKNVNEGKQAALQKLIGAVEKGMESAGVADSAMMSIIEVGIRGPELGLLIKEKTPGVDVHLDSRRTLSYRLGRNYKDGEITVGLKFGGKTVEWLSSGGSSIFSDEFLEDTENYYAKSMPCDVVSTISIAQEAMSSEFRISDR